MTGTWFENDAFWDEFHDLMFSERSFEAAKAAAPRLIELVGFEGRDVLDLCCGPGRYALPLAAAGYRVTGVDRTRSLLERARQRADALGVEIEWVHSDMRQFVRPEAFDLALNMYTSFGYFDDAGENLLTLRNICSSLRPGGTLVIDVVGKEGLAAIFQPTTSHILPDGRLMVERHVVLDSWKKIRNEWLVIEGDRVRRFSLEHWLYSAYELEQLLLQAGFESVRLYRNLRGEDYGPGATRLVAAASK